MWYICHLFAHRCKRQGTFFVFLNSDCCQRFVSVMVVRLVGESFYAQSIFSTEYLSVCMICLALSWQCFFQTSRGMCPVMSDKVGSTSWGGLLKFPTILGSFNWVIDPCIGTVSYSLWLLITSRIEMGCQLWIMKQYSVTCGVSTLVMSFTIILSPSSV